MFCAVYERRSRADRPSVAPNRKLIGRRRPVSTSGVSVGCHRSGGKIEFGTRTGLPSISDVICKRRSSVFCHVARLPASTAAHRVLKLQVDLSVSRSADWKQCPGCRHVWWVDATDQVARSSWINCVRITTTPQLTYGVPTIQERPFRSDATVILAEYTR